MSSSHSPRPDKPDGNKDSNVIVVRAGNDHMQSDMINLMMSRNEYISREQALLLLEKYATHFENILKQQHNRMASVAMWPIFSDKVTPDINSAPAGAEVYKAPILTDCLNVVSNSRTVMWGSVVQLYGQHLIFDRTDAKQGLFLIEPLRQSIIKITTLVRVKPESVIFMIPGNLPAASYQIELKTRCPRTGVLRSSILSEMLCVII